MALGLLGAGSLLTLGAFAEVTRRKRRTSDSNFDNKINDILDTNILQEDGDFELSLLTLSGGDTAKAASLLLSQRQKEEQAQETANDSMEQIGKNALSNVGITVVNDKTYLDPIAAINDVEGAMFGGIAGDSGGTIEEIEIGDTSIIGIDAISDQEHSENGTGGSAFTPLSNGTLTSGVNNPLPTGDGGTPND
ncbi:hypothetical protein [Lactococcus sp.]|uniref:hypothetical protein n=1 Tax=Lactococcus sp. TaxID=44273 RepID=UPI0035AD9325